MLKYEEKLHFDEHYKKLRSAGGLWAASGLIWGSAGFVLLYVLFRFILLPIPDAHPWDGSAVWFVFGGVRFVKADLVYFAWGLVMNCYGSLRLAKVTEQNHSARSEKNDIPSCLLRDGFYAQTRHPMYGTFAVLQAGFFLSLRSLVGMLAALLLTTMQYFNAFHEEKKQLIPAFGEEYGLYAKAVPAMLLTKPQIFTLGFFTAASIAGFVF